MEHWELNSQLRSCSVQDREGGDPGTPSSPGSRVISGLDYPVLERISPADEGEGNNFQLCGSSQPLGLKEL